jgi:hypothetical protein
MSDIRKPTLFAFLICEKVLSEQDKAMSLIRIVDTFNLEVGVTAEITEKDPLSPAVSITFQVFTRWGNGKGEFTEGLMLVRPDGVESTQAVKSPFKLTDERNAHQIVHHVVMTVRDSGVYKLRAYLNGDQVAELPFIVNIKKVVVQPGSKPKQQPQP